MKAKDLINLLFKVEENKEIQESLFYSQFDTISQYFREYHRNEFREQLTKQLNDMYISTQNMELLNTRESSIFNNVLRTIASKNNLNINDIIN
jgi:hypothetical protein